MNALAAVASGGLFYGDTSVRQRRWIIHHSIGIGIRSSSPVNARFPAKWTPPPFPAPPFPEPRTPLELRCVADSGDTRRIATAFGQWPFRSHPHSERYKAERDAILQDIAILALPAALALAVEPVSQLVETAFIGRIGRVELAAVGVSMSIVNLVSKVFNVPLLNATTSFVAEDYASATHPSIRMSVIEKPERICLPAVSSALTLSLLLGIVEAAVLFLGAGFILSIMGVALSSPMQSHSLKYLSLRALGAPAMVASLTVQGIFRGLRDTKTPLYATVAGNIFNVVLDILLIVFLKLGTNGAALATVISQYVISCFLIWSLNKHVVLIPPKLADLNFNRFIKSGGLLIGRTMSLLFTMTLATSMAAQHGAISMASHQIIMQIWLATSLLSDGLALAGQALMASAFAEENCERAKKVAFLVLQMGLLFGTFLGITLYLSSGVMFQLFTKDADVLNVLSKGVWFLAGTQPFNALAFVFDGIHYGASDFAYAAYSMIFVSVLSSTCLVIAPKLLGLPGVWIGLTLVMVLRATAGFLRLGTATGPWRFLRRPGLIKER